MIRPTLIDLNPDELHNHPFMISLDRYNGSCNTFDGLNGRICVMSKTRVIDLKVFLMRTLKNTLESYLKENIYIYNSEQFNLQQKCNSNKYQRYCKGH